MMSSAHLLCPAVRFFSLFFVISLTFPSVSAIAKESSKVVQVFVAMEEIQPQHFRGVANLESLPAGETVVLEVEVHNRSGDRSITLASPSATCGCMSAEITASEIPPGESAKMVVTVNVPKTNIRASLWQQHVSFNQVANLKPNETRAIVVFRSELGGVLSTPLESTNILLQVVEGSKENSVATQEVPLLITEPVKFENLKVAGSENLNLLSASLSRDKQGSPVLIISAASKDISSEGLAANLKVLDTHTGAEVQFVVTVSRRSPLEILPTILRLKATENGQTLTGTAYLKNRESKDSTETTPTPPMITGKILGVSTKITTQIVNSSTCRIQYSINREDLDELIKTNYAKTGEAALKATWSVVWGNQKSELETPVVINE